MRKHITSRTAILTIGILSAIAYYILACYTPLYVDDYFFDFFAAPEELKNIPAYRYFTFYTERFAGVSRFIPHLAVAFTQWSGKWLFNILSTLGYVLLCILLARAATHNRAKQLPLAALSAAMLWFILPGFFQAFLWMSGACNYLFVAILVLIFYLLFTSAQNVINKWWQAPLWFIYGFITGWTNEGFIVGLAAGCTLYLLLNRHEFHGRRLMLYCGLICGAIPLCLSPLNITRFMDGHSGPFSISGFIFGIAQSIFALTDIYITFLLIFTVILILIFKRKSLNKNRISQFLHTHIILITALLVSCAFLLLSRHTSANSRVPMEMYSSMIFLVLIARIPTRPISSIAIVSSILMVISIIMTIPSAILNSHNYNLLKDQITSVCKIISTTNTAVTPFQSRYVIPPSKAVYPNLIEAGHQIIQFYHGDSNAVIFPQQIIERQNCPVWTRLHMPDWGISWIKLPENSIEIQDVTFMLTPTDPMSLPIWQRPLINYLTSLSVNTLPANYQIISQPDTSNNWLIVYDNPAIAKRVKTIQVIHK